MQPAACNLQHAMCDWKRVYEPNPFNVWTGPANRQTGGSGEWVCQVTGSMAQWNRRRVVQRLQRAVTADGAILQCSTTTTERPCVARTVRVGCELNLAPDDLVAAPGARLSFVEHFLTARATRSMGRNIAPSRACVLEHFDIMAKLEAYRALNWIHQRVQPLRSLLSKGPPPCHV